MEHKEIEQIVRGLRRASLKKKKSMRDEIYTYITQMVLENQVAALHNCV